jgi:hypothetical protein
MQHRREVVVVEAIQLRLAKQHLITGVVRVKAFIRPNACAPIEVLPGIRTDIYYP